jgi:hypothetical protein
MGDFDGFPTDVKRRYWDHFGTSETVLENNRIRTVAEETVGNSAYSPNEREKLLESKLNLEGGNSQLSKWNNMQNGLPSVGKNNFLPLSTTQAMKIYWKLHGFILQAPLLQSKQGGASIDLLAPSTLTLRTDLVGASAEPYERIWRGSEFTVGNRQNRQEGIDFASDSAIFERYLGKEYFDNVFVDQTFEVFPSWGCLARYNSDVTYDYDPETNPNGLKENEGAFGFDQLLRLDYSQTKSREARRSYNTGSATKFVTIQIGTQFFLPENIDDSSGDSIDTTEYSIEKVYIGGIPLLVFKEEKTIEKFALKGASERIDVGSYDLVLWNDFV